MVKTLPSNTKGAGLIPWGTKSPLGRAQCCPRVRNPREGGPSLRRKARANSKGQCHQAGPRNRHEAVLRPRGQDARSSVLDVSEGSVRKLGLPTSHMWKL